ncbi:hypothetical protein [Lewinella sp. LCG006]|uniref:hypothetical protein n=1 Tax=Lewinella sp. LCG006 TaxID=3231911 RepID=UPI0034605FFE
MAYPTLFAPVLNIGNYVETNNQVAGVLWLGGLVLFDVPIIDVGGKKYYDVGQHIYKGNDGWSTQGSRAEQMTINSRVGIQLISNLDNLPNAPADYSAPDWYTTNPDDIALSQQQANLYDNCEGVCYATSESRAQQAYIDESGSGIVDLTVSGGNIDHRIAATVGTNDPFIGYGAGGPFSRRGYGETVNNTGVWNGNLQQGALLQKWNTTDQDNLYARGGHYVIFRRYSFDNDGNINGIYISDYHGSESLWERAAYENRTTILGVNLMDTNEND